MVAAVGFSWTLRFPALLWKDAAAFKPSVSMIVEGLQLSYTVNSY
jgi:hypothetical protein